MYKYTNLTFTELVNKIGGARYWNLPPMLKEILSRLTPQTSQVLPYKTYTALLTQVGTNPPQPTLLENTLGINLTYEYINPGRYTVQVTNEVNLSSALIYISSTTQYDGILIRVSDKTSNSFNINVTSIATDGTTIQTPGIDSALISTPIEIRIYS